MNPDDVARMTFSSSRKGYDPMEVQGFLVSVSAELRESRSRVLELDRSCALPSRTRIATVRSIRAA
jgi:DivIVA domain-containing protein